MIWHGGLKKRKKTGGKRKQFRSKKLNERGNHPIETKLGTLRKKIEIGKSRIKKHKLVSTNYVNVSDPSTGRTEQKQILDVIRNPANVDYNRRGVITKGTIIRTDIGLVKIVSRPGQDGILNGIIYAE
jgi:small subunit ribosomal protein S8e